MTVLLHSLALVFCLLAVSSCHGPCPCLHVEEIVPPQWRCREELFICRVRLIDGFLDDDSYEVSWTVPACFLGCDGMIALLFGSSFAFECWVGGSNDRVDEIRRERSVKDCMFAFSALHIRSDQRYLHLMMQIIRAYGGAGD
jgi:hypothetical protein